MRNFLSRFAYPGQDPSIPVESGDRNLVFDPSSDLPGGWIESTISADGLTIVNRTLPAHVFFDGQVTRSAVQNEDGSWSVETHGTGNSLVPGMAGINQSRGPEIFDRLDAQMRSYLNFRPVKGMANGQELAARSTSFDGSALGGGRRLVADD